MDGGCPGRRDASARVAIAAEHFLARESRPTMSIAGVPYGGATAGAPLKADIEKLLRHFKCERNLLGGGNRHPHGAAELRLPRLPHRDPGLGARLGQLRPPSQAEYQQRARPQVGKNRHLLGAARLDQGAAHRRRNRKSHLRAGLCALHAAARRSQRRRVHARSQKRPAASARARK